MHKSYGTGRRKTSSARVYLNEGTGVIKINSRELDDIIERKKVGLRKARKATQFSKR